MHHTREAYMWAITLGPYISYILGSTKILHRIRHKLFQTGFLSWISMKYLGANITNMVISGIQKLVHLPLKPFVCVVQPIRRSQLKGRDA